MSLETELGEKFFLIDSGCPVSFASQAKTIIVGAWFTDDEVKLASAPFSLRPISERLGVPLEGFIGLRDLIKQWRIYFDFDKGEILLGDSTRHVIHDPEEASVISLEKMMGAPIGMKATINIQDFKHEDTFYLDTGSRFVILSKPTADEDGSPKYRVDLLTPNGAQKVALSAEAKVEIELSDTRLISKKLCYATMTSNGLPNILGTEWLSQFNIFLSFEDRKLMLWPRSKTSKESWERFTDDLYGPQLEFVFDPNEYDKMNRCFSVMPRANYPLPEGLMPMTKYRLKDYVIPVGVEGVNRFTSEAFNYDNSFETELDFIDETGREVWVTIKRLFTH